MNRLMKKKMNNVGNTMIYRTQVHNAFSDKVITRIHEALDDIKGDSGIRAMFLRANGKSFCAGGDLEWMKRAAGYSREENIADAGKGV